MEVCEESRAAPMNSSSSSSGCEMNSECPHAAIVKGRRTKRPRVHQSTFSGEEEDLALCLMLLAQGGAKTEEEDGGDGEKLSSERLNSNGKTGAFLYECKTCSKCFPSFQALGGHRSSHKKLKTDLAEEKGEKDENFRLNLLPIFHIAANSEVNGKTRRMHECSICGLEFSSGQALGGHMRRHRAVAAAPQKDKKEKCSISLDLNLPAPADEEREHFRDFIFSAPALVDCHY